MVSGCNCVKFAKLTSRLSPQTIHAHLVLLLLLFLQHASTFNIGGKFRYATAPQIRRQTLPQTPFASPHHSHRDVKGLHLRSTVFLRTLLKDPTKVTEKQNNSTISESKYAASSSNPPDDTSAGVMASKTRRIKAKTKPSTKRTYISIYDENIIKPYSLADSFNSTTIKFIINVQAEVNSLFVKMEQMFSKWGLVIKSKVERDIKTTQRTGEFISRKFVRGTETIFTNVETLGKPILLLPSTVQQFSNMTLTDQWSMIRAGVNPLEGSKLLGNFGSMTTKQRAALPSKRSSPMSADSLYRSVRVLPNKLQYDYQRRKIAKETSKYKNILPSDRLLSDGSVDDANEALFFDKSVALPSDSKYPFDKPMEDTNININVSNNDDSGNDDFMYTVTENSVDIPETFNKRNANFNGAVTASNSRVKAKTKKPSQQTKKLSAAAMAMKELSRQASSPEIISLRDEINWARLVVTDMLQSFNMDDENDLQKNSLIELKYILSCFESAVSAINRFMAIPEQIMEQQSKYSNQVRYQANDEAAVTIGEVEPEGGKDDSNERTAVATAATAAAAVSSSGKIKVALQLELKDVTCIRTAIEIIIKSVLLLKEVDLISPTPTDPSNKRVWTQEPGVSERILRNKSLYVDVYNNLELIEGMIGLAEKEKAEGRRKKRQQQQQQMKRGGDSSQATVGVHGASHIDSEFTYADDAMKQDATVWESTVEKTSVVGGGVFEQQSIGSSEDAWTSFVDREQTQFESYDTVTANVDDDNQVFDYSDSYFDDGFGYRVSYEMEYDDLSDALNGSDDSSYDSTGTSTSSGSVSFVDTTAESSATREDKLKKLALEVIDVVLFLLETLVKSIGPLVVDGGQQALSRAKEILYLDEPELRGVVASAKRRRLERRNKNENNDDAQQEMGWTVVGIAGNNMGDAKGELESSGSGLWKPIDSLSMRK